MLDNEIIKKILLYLKPAQKILVLGHARPDGDSMGAVLAWQFFLERLGKTADAFANCELEQNLQFLPQSKKIIVGENNLAGKTYDLIFLLDVNPKKITGAQNFLEQEQKNGVPIINIDHHPRPTDQYDLSLIIEDAGATCKILYDFFKQANITITPDMATCLLTGILIDTFYYTNGATNFSVLKAGAELLRLGATLLEILKQTYQNKRLPILRLWGKVLLRLEEDPQTGITTTAITLKDLEEEKLSGDEAGGITNFLNSLGDAKAVMLLSEQEGGKVKGSLRTTRNDVDVSEIARTFGGGGHKKAAGFLVPGHLIKTEKGWEIVE